MRTIEAKAVFVYESCRLEAIASERPIVPEPWEQRDESFKDQFIKTIHRICAPGYISDPEKEHENWVKAYESMGWKYGPERDAVKKTHPDMVPYNQLVKKEKDKDEIFLAICDIARRFIK